MTITETGYRSRIYNSYLSARAEPISIEEVRTNLHRRAPYIRQIIRRHFPSDKNAQILDLACGHGAFLYFAYEAGYRNGRGVDGSGEQVEKASALGITGVLKGDIFDFLRSEPDESADVVICFDIIEHLTRDELLDFVDDIRRVLKPGGKWIIHTPNAESPFGGAMRYWDLTHEMAFTRTSLGQLLLSSGFRSCQSFDDTPVVHGSKSAIRWGVWQIIRGMLRLWIAAETGETNNRCVLTRNFLTVAVR
jgi:2-polyprenyl-3-methyl-5-hydroxy-6-metoxy-1,4-benzoquinol methylase